jgi:hypothetical protein
MASVLPKNINAADLRFSDLKSLDNGSKTSYVSNKGSRVFVQTPLMHLPYGINNSADMEAKKNPGKPVVGPPRYDVCVAFRDMERNHKVKELYDCMIGVQNAVIDAAFTNRLAWFRNDFKGNRDFVVDKFQPIIKLDLDPETNEPRNRGYAPTMKAKLPYDADNDAFTFECVDADKNVLDFKKIVEKMKGGKAQLLIQLTGLWFAGGRFGCSWKVHKAKFEMPGGIHGTGRRTATVRRTWRRTTPKRRRAASRRSSSSRRSRASRPLCPICCPTPRRRRPRRVPRSRRATTTPWPPTTPPRRRRCPRARSRRPRRPESERRLAYV